MKKILNIKSLKEEAKNFCMYENNLNHSELLGVTDGKAIGTFIEHRFKEFLSKKYSFTSGSSSSA